MKQITFRQKRVRMEKNVFEIPVEALDKGIECAAYSKKKETWYDRTLVVRLIPFLQMLTKKEIQRL